MRAATGPLLNVTAVLITREREWPADACVSGSFAEFRFDEVLIETECPGVHRRFELAQQARNEVIYVQDDDCQTDIDRLYRAYDGRLTYAITAGHKILYDELCGSRACLIGWGAFFPKRFADPTRWQAYVDTYGPVPSHEADRVFTWFCDARHPVVMPIQMLRRTHAMSRDNREHYTSRDRMLRQLKDL